MNKIMNREKLLQWIPLMIGIMASIAFILKTGPNVVDFADARDYMAAARSLISSEGYPREATLPFFRPPLYPLFIAGIWTVVPQSVVAVKLVQAILFGATAWLIFQMGFTVFKNREVALIGGIFYALNPFLLSTVGDIQTESLHTFLFATGMYAATRMLLSEEFRFRDTLLTGFAFGLAALCRPSALLVGFVVILSVFYYIVRTRGAFQRAWRSSGVALVIMALTIAPWTFANWQATREFILITDGGGFTAWVGNNPESIRAYTDTFKSPREFMYLNSTYLQDILVKRKINEWERTGGYHALSLKGRENRWRQETLGNIKQHPWLTTKLWGYKLWGYWRPWLHPAAYSFKVVLVSAVIWVSLYALALYGAIASWKLERGRLLTKLLIMMFLACTFVHVATLSMLRYRLPYVDPYLCVLSGYACWLLFCRVAVFRQRK